MTKIEKIILKYLKQNDKNDHITNIIVNYNISVLIRNSEKFIPDDGYCEEVLTKECYMGDLILRNKKYRLNCNFLLEDDEIYFS